MVVDLKVSTHLRVCVRVWESDCVCVTQWRLVLDTIESKEHRPSDRATGQAMRHCGGELFAWNCFSIGHRVRATVGDQPAYCMCGAASLVREVVLCANVM
jgi:hypothetical protein